MSNSRTDSPHSISLVDKSPIRLLETVEFNDGTGSRETRFY